MELSSATTGTAGILLITIAAVEYGGVFLFGLVGAGRSSPTSSGHSFAPATLMPVSS